MSYKNKMKGKLLKIKKGKIFHLFLSCQKSNRRLALMWTQKEKKTFTSEHTFKL